MVNRTHLERLPRHERKANTGTVGYATIGAVKRDANKRPATDTQNSHAYSKFKAGVGINNGVVILTTLACTLHIEMRKGEGRGKKTKRGTEKNRILCQQTLTCKMTTKIDKNSQNRR